MNPKTLPVNDLFRLIPPSFRITTHCTAPHLAVQICGVIRFNVAMVKPPAGACIIRRPVIA